MLNQLIIKTMPIIPKFIIKRVAGKYIAGDNLEDAVRVTKELEAAGGMSTIDVLGEFVDNKERALHETKMCEKVIDAIAENKLPSYPSLKPTSLGLGIDEDFAFENIKSCVQKSAEKGLQITIDMENSPYTTKTLDLYKRLRAEGFDNIGIVIQAYMRRSAEDIKEVAKLNPFVRLCKGIYREAENIAFQGKEEVRDNYKKLLQLLYDEGLYTCIATHDEPLIQHATEFISKNNIKREDYEFQMLLGVRDKRRESLIKDGHRLRVYVPFGSDWYGYSTRRVKENPKMASQIFKAMFINN